MQISIYSIDQQSIENEPQEPSKGKFVLKDNSCYQKHLQEARFFSTFCNPYLSVIGFIQIVLGGCLLYYYCSGKNVRELQFAVVGLGAVWGGCLLLVMRNKRKYVKKIRKICVPLETIEFKDEFHAKYFSMFFNINFERIMYFLSEKESNITEKTFKKVDNLLNFIVMLKKDIRARCNQLEKEKEEEKIEEQCNQEVLYKYNVLYDLLTNINEFAEHIKAMFNYNKKSPDEISNNNKEIAQCEAEIKNNTNHELKVVLAQEKIQNLNFYNKLNKLAIAKETNQGLFIQCNDWLIPVNYIAYMLQQQNNLILYNAFPKLHNNDKKAIEALLDAFILKEAELKEEITQWDRTYRGYKEKNEKEILQEIRTFYKKSDG